MENFDFLNSFVFPYVNWIIFLILATILFKKPLQNAFKSKRSSYLAIVERANFAKAEAEARQNELAQQLQRLDGEMNRMRKEVQDAAEQEANAILASATQLADHLKREAHSIAAAEVAAAKDAVRAEILTLVREKTAEELLRTLDEGRQHQIIQRNLDSLSGSKELSL